MKLYKIKKSKIDKNGLYANRDIKQGTRIIEYKGKIISNRQSEEDPSSLIMKRLYIFLILIKNTILMVILNLIQPD